MIQRNGGFWLKNFPVNPRNLPLYQVQSLTIKLHVHSLELANAINQSFLKVAQEMNPLPEVHHIPTSIDRDLISSKFYVSIENTVMALNSLKVSKAKGPDDIPNWILKTYSTQLSGPVTSIFNASIQESYVPQQWKVADVIPINKVPIVKDLDNDLRLISLTPTLSKVMERCPLPDAQSSYEKSTVVFRRARTSVQYCF